MKTKVGTLKFNNLNQDVKEITIQSIKEAMSSEKKIKLSNFPHFRIFITNKQIRVNPEYAKQLQLAIIHGFDMTINNKDQVELVLVPLKEVAQNGNIIPVRPNPAMFGTNRMLTSDGRLLGIAKNVPFIVDALISSGMIEKDTYAIDFSLGEPKELNEVIIFNNNITNKSVKRKNVKSYPIVITKVYKNI
jgi:nucleoid DNA-binding protein